MQMDFRPLYNISTNTPSPSYNAYNKFLNTLPSLRALLKGVVHILYNALMEERVFRNLLYVLYEGEGVFVLMLYNALKSICII